jgi:predicted nucleic acid-binding protein
MEERRPTKPTNPMLVLDASIILKLVTEEAGSQEAERYLADMAERVAPDLAMIEVAAGLAKKVRRGSLEVSAAKEAFAATPALLDEVVPSASFVPAAFELSLRLRHPPHDCLYLVIARERGGRLLTADAKFSAAAARDGFGEEVELLR